jgi:hypothetical protein
MLLANEICIWVLEVMLQQIYKFQVCTTAITGPQTGYPDGVFLWFSSDYPATCWDSNSN